MTVMASERIPYDAKHVFVIDERTGIYAFWTADPQKAADAKAGRINVGAIIMSYDFETVATARRFYRYEGAGFSGWVVESGGYNSDRIRNKREAMRQLRYAINDYFNH